MPSATNNTTPTHAVLTTDDPDGYKSLFKERFTEARKVGLHYTVACCSGQVAKIFRSADVKYYLCERYSSKAELRSATAAVFTEDCAQAFFELLDSEAYLDQDDRLYIAPWYLSDASVWQAEDTVVFQDQAVETFIWDSLTVTEADNDTICYTLDWYQTYPCAPTTSAFTLIKGEDGIWRFNVCFSVTSLTAAEVEQYNKAFEPVLLDGEGNRSINPISHFFTSYYNRPEDIDLGEFLRYFPGEADVTDGAEFEALKVHESWPFGDAESPDSIPVPIHRIPTAAVNEVLKKYIGITLGDLSGVGTQGLIYLKQYNAYYTYTSDFGPGVFVCSRGEREGDIVRLYGERATLTLKLEGDGYLIVSHQHAGES